MCVCFCMLVFCFFKQKTAYEMRISDWSSDVCSSDLILQSLIVPDKNGMTADVVLGFDDVQGYQKNGNVYFGATIGRFGNRLAGGAFELDGKRYQVTQNDKSNYLHGGPLGFDKRVWKAEPHDGKDSVGVTLTYMSADGELGFPGALKTDVTYSLNEKNELRIEYQTTTHSTEAPRIGKKRV